MAMKKTYPVIGMACAGCTAQVERTLKAVNGVSEATVSLATRCATVTFDEQNVDAQQLREAVAAAGYELVTDETQSADTLQRGEYVRLRRKVAWAWLFAVSTMAVSMEWVSVGATAMRNQLSLLLALGGLVVCASQFYVRAGRQLLHRSATMDTLVALSTAVSFAFSTAATLYPQTGWPTYFDASIMIVAFVLTGRLLEEKAKDSTAASLRRLMGLQPKTAHLVSGETTCEVPLTTIEPGDIIEVRAGEHIPVDGTVIWAESFMTPDAAYVDESSLTGEPTPTRKQQGDTVMAGTAPSQGRLRLRARQVGAQTALAHIIHTVQTAQNSKAPVQRITDRMVEWFVPIVASLSLLTLAAWWLASDNLPEAVVHGVAVLVVACPCALGLATPTALMVGMGKAAEHQILIKDAATLERVRSVTAMVVDKTGTLTHPNDVVDFTLADTLAVEERETLRPHAAEAMAMLHDMGVEVWMMSGDREEAVAHWAGKLGITRYQSGAHPEDKEALVRRLQAEGKIVAMVGDGINDTSALALADVSVAMSKGTDVAMDVAGATLMSDDLRRLPEAIVLSRQTVKMIGQNLFWALAYNVICIPLAAGVPQAFGIDMALTPSVAAVLMALSSVSVVLNSLRLRLMH